LLLGVNITEGLQNFSAEECTLALLNVTLHSRQGTPCPTRLQAWAFKTKIAMAVTGCIWGLKAR